MRGEREAHRRDRGRGHRQARDAQAREDDGHGGVCCGLAAHARGLARLPRCGGRRRDEVEDGWLPAVDEVAERAAEAVGGHRVLREVVRPHGHEVDLREDRPGAQRCRRNLDHDADRRQAVGPRGGGEVTCLGGRRDHRRHDPRLHTSLTLCVCEGGELRVEEVRDCPHEAVAAHTEGRVLLLGLVSEREGLVGACVEGPHDDLATAEGAQHARILAGLLLARGCGRPVEEHHLGAEQADTLDGGGGDPLGVVGAADVREERDRRAVGESAGSSVLGEPRRELGATREARCDVVRRVGLDGPGERVDRDRRALGEVERPGDADDARDAELARDDRGVARGATELGHDGPHEAQVERSGVGGSEVLGDDDGRSGQGGHPGLRQPEDLCRDPVADRPQVGHPLGEQAARRGEHVDERPHGGVERRDRGGAVGDAGEGLLAQGAVGRHLCRRPQHGGRRFDGTVSLGPQAARDHVEGVDDRGLGCLAVCGGALGDPGRRRSRDVHDRADGCAAADAGPGEDAVVGHVSRPRRGRARGARRAGREPRRPEGPRPRA